MKQLHEYSDRSIHLIIISWFLLCIMLGFEAALCFGYKQPETRTSQERLILIRERTEEEESECEDTLTEVK